MTAVAATSNGFSFPSLRLPQLYVREKKQLGDPFPLAALVARAALDSVSGGGNLNALVRWVSPSVREHLLKQQSLARRAGKSPGVLTVVRTHMERINERIAEFAVIIRDGDFTRAVALRVEEVNCRWLTTAVHVL